MAAITNYSTLKSAVEDLLGRSDLTSEVPAFIAQAESRFNRRIRARDMETTDSLSLNASGEATLPSDFLEYRLLSCATTPVSWPEKVDMDSDEFLFRHRPNANPQYVGISGTTIIVRPLANVSATLYYYQEITALSDVATTNWLVTKAPDVYLYGAALEAAIYVRDQERIAMYGEMLTSAIDELTNERRAESSGRPPEAQPAPGGRTLESAGPQVIAR